jgi:hypothetical protein
MLTVNPLHSSLMMSLEFRNIIDFPIIRHWATLASECSGSNHSWLCTERNYFGDFRSLECSSVELPSGNSCFWRAHLKYYFESFSCRMWNIWCTCWMLIMNTSGNVFPVGVFAMLVTYDAVLCRKVVEIVLYLCYSDMQQSAVFWDHTTLWRNFSKCIQWKHNIKLFYVFFWVIPRRLNFMCRRFGTLCSIFIGW